MKLSSWQKPLKTLDIIYMKQWFSHVGDKVQQEQKQNETLLPVWEISGCITERENVSGTQWLS